MLQAGVSSVLKKLCIRAPVRALKSRGGGRAHKPESAAILR